VGAGDERACGVTGKNFVKTSRWEPAAFFTTREETAKFMESDEIRETEKKLRGFLKEFGAFKSSDPEKLSAYECGFNAFDDARMTFDVRFYLVSILFIIFDLEVAFLFPWAITFKDVGLFGFWSMMVFLGVLTIGFVYEWMKGALEWD